MVSQMLTGGVLRFTGGWFGPLSPATKDKCSFWEDHRFTRVRA